MNYSIVIPAHNEEAFLEKTLASVVAQTTLPVQVVVVDDNSTDNTFAVASRFADKFPFISAVKNSSDAVHLPGSKVIRAFHAGFESITSDFDIIVKLDADLILPRDYFARIIATFQSNDKIGMAGGFCYVEKNGQWVLENLTDKDHIRGALKSYRRECFEQIGRLKPAMGWDTVDELLCRYYGWKVVTIPELQVKHLKPTGANYNKAARYKQGEAFYSLGYGFLITAIASAKLAMMKKKPLLFLDYINGFLKAQRQNKEMLVTHEQARFIRKYRMDKMRKKLF